MWWILIYLLLVVVAVLFVLFRLFSAPKSNGKVLFHRFPPKTYAENNVDALALRALGKTVFHGGSSEALLREASGLVADNMGYGESTHWKKPFGMLVEVLNTSPTLSVVGRQRLRSYLLHSLQVRLKLTKYCNENATALSELKLPDEKVVFVTGLPRSGTTLVHNLLACDKSKVAFDYADYYDPLEVMASKEDNVKDQLESVKRALPNLSRKHNLRASKKEDDYFLWKHAFLNPILALSIRNAERYRDWMFDEATDLTPFYEELRTFYKVLLLKKQVDSFEHLVVKSPFHASFFRALRSEFPASKVVVMNRSPKLALVSFCSVLQTINSYYDWGVDRRQLGQVATDFALYKQFAARKEEVPDEQMATVLYKWCMIDPMMAVKAIYAAFDWKYAPIAERNLYVRDNPPELFGRHTYNPKDFSLDSDTISKTFEEHLVTETPQKKKK